MKGVSASTSTSTYTPLVDKLKEVKVPALQSAKVAKRPRKRRLRAGLPLSHSHARRENRNQTKEGVKTQKRSWGQKVESVQKRLSFRMSEVRPGPFHGDALSLLHSVGGIGVSTGSSLKRSGALHFLLCLHFRKPPLLLQQSPPDDALFSRRLILQKFLGSLKKPFYIPAQLTAQG